MWHICSKQELWNKKHPLLGNRALTSCDSVFSKWFTPRSHSNINAYYYRGTIGSSVFYADSAKAV
jgi:hypothetical protein